MAEKRSRERETGESDTSGTMTPSGMETGGEFRTEAFAGTNTGIWKYPEDLVRPGGNRYAGSHADYDAPPTPTDRTAFGTSTPTAFQKSHGAY